jgi:hypothetical protein
MEYEDFILAKSQLDAGDGFTPLFLPDFLFDFQQSLVDWSIKTGRAAKFADCGMGKTPMQLVWAQNIVMKTNRPVLIMAPLSVSQQTVEEAEKFSIEAKRVMDGKHAGAKIIVTNYERLHYFDPADFAGVVCDESSIIKNFDGSRKSQITDFMRKIDYRLLCTATAAPNDYIELGTSSEALGYLGYMDMLTMFFKNDEDTINPINIGAKWRFKRHAEKDFWRWVASWARACRKPSDLGFDDGTFVLPGLIETESACESPVPFGEMFHKHAVTLEEQRDDNRATIEQRCEIAAKKLDNADSAIAWCHLNKEAETLVEMIPGAVEVSGSDPDELKEEKFDDFRKGRVRVLTTKPRIAAFGMNWQHCHRMTYFPTHSYEQYYQAVRRCWRFGQTHDVTVDIITSEAQKGVLRNMQQKAAACEKMFESLVFHMNNALGIKRLTPFNHTLELPSWL